MAFGDYLKKNMYLLSETSTKPRNDDSLSAVLKEIAKKDILGVYPSKVDSDVAIRVYYQILNENENLLPPYYLVRLLSNEQPRYRVVTRNVFVSNAFNSDGLAKQKELLAVKKINENRCGFRIVYQGVEEYVD